jgi:hypothetical protein
MVFSKEYVGYFAREVVKRMIASKRIQTKDVNGAIDRVHAALLDELGLEDRINEDARRILDAYQEEMRKTGASYQEMFKKVKGELVKKYKAVL